LEQCISERSGLRKDDVALRKGDVTLRLGNEALRQEDVALRPVDGDCNREMWFLLKDAIKAILVLFRYCKSSGRV
jgi:hypothetical protein